MEESHLGNSKSTITMRIDKADDDNDKAEIDEEKPFQINPTKICSPISKPILAGSKLAAVTNCFSSPNSGTVLRPFTLTAGGSGSNNVQNKPLFALNPSKLNPFANIPSDDITTCDLSSGNKKEKEEVKNEKVINGSTPKFIPLEHEKAKQSQEGETGTSGISSTTSNCQASSISTNNFVFGQNIKDRVMTDASNESNPSSCTFSSSSSTSSSFNRSSSSSTSCSSSSSSSNGASDMLFTSALKENSATCENNTTTTNAGKKESKTLSESAREYEEARAVKRKYEEVEIKTGEEGETNVLQISCKLFTFDKSIGGNWQERGRGTLRLNDQEIGDKIQSRLVFRTNGSLRVILNTKIWSEMTVQQASDKSVRLTAFDNGEIRVFLVMGNQEDIRQLYKHLELRVKRESESQCENENKTSSQEAPTPTVESFPKKIAVDTGGN